MSKRFTRIVCSNDEYTGSLFCDDEPLKIDAVCTLLNENEQLKLQHRKLQIEFNDVCGIVYDLRESKLDLEDENEELKQTIQDMRIRFKRKYDHEFDDIVDELD